MYSRWPESFLVLAILASLAPAQAPEKDDQPEQTVLGSDAGSAEEFTRRPVEVPPAALQVLRDTLHRGTVNCLKNHGITPENVPASWFVASEIHLAGPDEVDLIVRPNVMKIGQRGLPRHEASACLLGANAIPFWVLRNTSGRYGLLLETYALRLEVLDSRTNFYRDIQTVASTAVTRTTILYKMAVAQYQIAEKKTEP